MSLYIGKIGKKWYHTYSQKLRDKYFGERLGIDYISVFTLGTGKSGATKVRGTEMSLSRYEITHVKGKLSDIARTESGKLVH